MRSEEAKEEKPAMTETYKSHGTQLKMGDGATPEVFTLVPHAGDIDGPEIGNEKLDVTTHDSPDRSQEFIAGDKTAPQVTFSINWDPADVTHQDLMALADSGELCNFQEIFTDADEETWQFAAMVSKFHPKAPVKGVLQVEVALEVSGEIDTTVGS
jgi:hypothetical protein